MAVKGHLSDSDRTILEAALGVGHAASHRGHSSSMAEANTVMDILENALQALYVLGQAAQTLKQTTPPRQKQEKQS
jgi:hypothetical protein